MVEFASTKKRIEVIREAKKQDTNIWIAEDYSKIALETQKKLTPFLKDARNNIIS